MLALIPLFFAIQQALEGMQWLYIGQNKISLLAAYTFLFFGFIMWPIYVPSAFYQIYRSRALMLFIGSGIVTAFVYLAAFLMHPPNVQVLGHSIDYGYTVPLSWAATTLYAVTILGAFVVQKDPFLLLMGGIVGTAALITQLFFVTTFASVWCFFAAVASSLIYVYIWQKSSVLATKQKKDVP